MEATALQGPVASESTPVVVPVTPGDVGDLAARLVDEARRRRQVRFALGDRPLAPGLAAVAFEAVASVAGDLDLAFLVRLAAPPEPRAVRRWVASGLRSVAFGERFPIGSRESGSCDARLIAVLRILMEENVDTTWELAPERREGSLSEDAFRDLWHLAPPRVAADSSAAAAVSEWRQQHAPALLTYTRGPGFVRIIDRRGRHRRSASGRREDLLVLHGIQAAVFEAADGTRGPGQIAAEVGGGIEASRLDRLLRAFEDRALLRRGRGGEVVALPVWWRAIEFE